jgi:hypothetical protein
LCTKTVNLKMEEAHHHKLDLHDTNVPVIRRGERGLHKDYHNTSKQLVFEIGSKTNFLREYSLTIFTFYFFLKATCRQILARSRSPTDSASRTGTSSLLVAVCSTLLNSYL